jgi:hypothetical protein
LLHQDAQKESQRVVALHATKLQRDIAVIITVQDNFDVSSALLYLKFCRLGVMIIYLIMC